MQDRLTILGGSSPFTAGLIDALLYRVEELRPCYLVLHGRNRELLNLVCRYARLRLAPYGWRIDSSTEMQEALAGASIVVHQIR